MQDKTTDDIRAKENSVHGDMDSPLPGTPVTVRDPFPYLVTSGFSLDEKNALLERLMLESMDIRYKFGRLSSDVQMSLQARNVSINDISDVVKIVHPRYHDNIFKHQATDVSTAMGLLNDSWNFYFYGTLEYMVVKLGTAGDQVTLRVYKRSLDEYSKRRLFECPDGILGGSKREDEEDMVVKKANYDTSVYDTTLGDVRHVVSKLQMVMGVEELEVRLVSTGIEDHHLLLFFAVNSSLRHSQAIFPLSHERKERLMADGIWHVSCGDFIFQRKPQVSLNSIVK